MRIKLLAILLIFSGSIGFSQQVWNETSLGNKPLKGNKVQMANNDKFFTLNIQQLKNILADAPMREALTIPRELIVGFPDINGAIENFYVAEASNFSPELAALYPGIKAYRGVSVNNPSITISFSVSQLGLKTMRMGNGNTIFIEPVTTNNQVYTVFEKTGFAKNGHFDCLTEEDAFVADRLNDQLNNRDADDQILRTFRLAVSVTAEYTIYFGGTKPDALAGINATMTRVNPIFEQDFALTTELIPNEEDIIYLNPSSDPYAPSTNTGAWNAQLQSTLTSVIGEANYDIGHLFGAAGGGGNAGCIGCVCVNGQKGSGYTSPADAIPEGDNFDIDYVAHEMGHQFGANHTFSRSEGSGANLEPGSGSTIMGYAGITNADVQNHSDPYFHYFSILQVTNNIKNKTCPTETPLANNPPTVNAGGDFIIPVSTPFKLTADGSDTDGDAITYCWEQADVSNASNFIYPSSNATSGPLFRSFNPTTSETRFFPSFDKVLAGNLTSTWEPLPSVGRTLHFNVEVRDNVSGGGQTDSDMMQVTVNASGGAFSVSSPVANASAASNSNLNVTWNTAGTESAPFNSPNVNILLSTDNGQTFTEIVSNTANDGSENITIPSGSSSTQAYLIVESAESIFYSVSSRFLIDFQAETQCQSFDPAQSLPLAIADGPNGSAVLTTYSVPDFGDVGDVNVSVDITHTYVSDLRVYLQSPQGTVVNLWNEQCNDNQDFDITFDDSGSNVSCASPTVGTYKPSQPLSAFEGDGTFGLWQLRVKDNFAQDVGTLNDVVLEICTVEYVPLAIDDFAINNFNVYPNPTSGIFNVKFNYNGSNITYNVYDLLGRVVKSEKETATGNISKQIDITNMPQGVYILKIDTDNGSVSRKLIKE